METKKRDFINILRGSAIFLMLWGHSLQYFSLDNFDFFENEVFQGIYSFHMPLFMIISGYLFYFSYRKRSFGELVKQKTKNLLHPIITGSIISYFLSDFLFSFSSPLNYFKDLMYGGMGLSNITGFWFFWSVLACSVVVAVIFKSVKKPVLRAIFSISGIAVVAFFPNCEKNIWMYPYFVVGFVFAAIPEGKVKTIIKNIRYISLPLFPLLLLFYKKDHFIYTSGIHIFEKYDGINGLKIDLFRLIIGFVGSVFAITVIKIIFEVLYDRLKNMKFNLISSFGKKSLQIYFFQEIVLSRYMAVIYSKLCEILGTNFLIKNIILYNFIISPIIAIIAGIICLLIVQISEKLKISKLIFGR